MTDLLQADDETQALELLHSKGLTDGLPVVDSYAGESCAAGFGDGS